VRFFVTLAIAAGTLGGTSYAAEVGRQQELLTPGVTNPQPAQVESRSNSVLPPADLSALNTANTESRLRIEPSDIHVEGVTVLAPDQVDDIVAGFRGRPLSDRDLNALREALSQAYLAAGYLNSGVVLPDQSMADGVLRLQAVEGSLSEIRLVGDTRLHEDFLVPRIERRVGSPLNVQALRDSIALLQRNPNIERIDAHIQPGSRQGQGTLALSLQEAPPMSVTLSLDNHQSEAIGAERARVGFAHTNLSGHADSLLAEIGASDGALTGAIVYERPLANEVVVQVYYSRDDADIVEDPFDALDINTETDLYGLSFTLPWIETLNTTLSITLGAEVKKSQSRLDGVRFSLSPGAEEGESRVSVGLLGTDWVRRTDQSVLALRGTVRWGFDRFGATDASPTPFDPSSIDGEFVSFLGQGQYTRRLLPQLDLALRGTAQLANDSLLGIEKLAVGGINTVRGYRENLLVRDNGVAASAELHWRPFMTSARPDWQKQLTVVTFADYGRSWDKRDIDLTSITRDTSDGRYIASLGLGVLWQPHRFVRTSLYWAEDIADNFSGSGDDPRDALQRTGLQDDGVHFAFSLRVPF